MRGLIVLTILIVTGFAFGDKEPEVAADAEVVKLHITNADCDTCVRSLNDALRTIVGIEEHDFDQEDHILSIEFDPVAMEREWIKKALQANGYQVKEV
ncbi:heavy-metal-associated domain-containing protein [Aquibacillus saliphilus]|uniref:heavy-metal-associated domain-containing protein n=1 Tax=Aquibacillus saliphilus TaxID=1909422 RepID=UPI001CF03D4B|nr:hypothetical protein [Aquibacillus saliphilus]